MKESASSRLSLSIQTKSWPLEVPFAITGYTFHSFDAVIVTLTDEYGHRGIGEGLGVYYLGDVPRTMIEQIEGARERIEAGISREALLDVLPRGGARNAVDCALWDLEAKRAGKPVWALIEGQAKPHALTTTFTLSAGEPETMADVARRFVSSEPPSAAARAAAKSNADLIYGARALKLKLTDDARNAERVRAVRAAAPEARIIVDANQGFTVDSFLALLPTLQETGVELVEQPFPMDRDEWLVGLDSPIPLAADESVQDRHDLEKMVGLVQVINIKLDKCGGLTEALAIVERGRALGFDLMVGNMSGSSWSMAPAFIVGQHCRVVDLDGPLYLSEDRAPAVRYADGMIDCADEVWGNGRETI